MSEGLQKRGSRWSDVPVLSYGFRIFFLLSAVSAIGLIATWLAVLLGLVWLGTIPAHLWHAHEMLFGVVAAAMAGFLLTAVPTWTGTPALAGPRLFALAFLWTIGRIASLPVFATSMFAAVIDIAFLPALGASLAAPLIAQGKLRNAVFLVLLAGLAVANLLFRLEWMGVTADSAHSGISLAVGIVLLMITVIGGRIIPAFTQNALRQQRPDFVIRTRPLLDRATILLTIVMIVLDMLARQSMTCCRDRGRMFGACPAASRLEIEIDLVATAVMDPASSLCLDPNWPGAEGCGLSWLRMGPGLAACHYHRRLYHNDLGCE